MTNRDVLAHRLLQCLCVATRPLRVEELAEVLALDFEADGETPTLIEGLRSDNPEGEVQFVCSSLIMIADTGHSTHSRVIQFSHFSVKQFLTSDRLATSQSDNSRFHIAPELAHMTLTQACLATLLQLNGSSNNDQIERIFPLARYASQHWVEHAQFGMVSSPSPVEYVRGRGRNADKKVESSSHRSVMTAPKPLRGINDTMRRLFDSTGPYFTTWLQLYNIDDHWNQFGNSWVARGSPLYYASLCGFRDLAEHIIKDHPEQVNAKGGRNFSPLVAALYKGHFHVAELLLQHGASINATGHNHQTPLQSASVDGRSDVASWLLNHGAFVHSRRDDLGAPIHLATVNGHPEAIQTLLEHGVDIDSADKDGRTPLHLASSTGKAEIVRLLLELGADPNVVDKNKWTPLSLTWKTEVERLLLDYGAQDGASLGKEGLNSKKKKKDKKKEKLRTGKYDSVRMLIQIFSLLNRRLDCSHVHTSDSFYHD